MADGLMLASMVYNAQHLPTSATIAGIPSPLAIRPTAELPSPATNDLQRGRGWHCNEGEGYR
jgi:hypothetical protein